MPKPSLSNDANVRLVPYDDDRRGEDRSAAHFYDSQYEEGDYYGEYEGYACGTDTHSQLAAAAASASTHSTGLGAWQFRSNAVNAASFSQHSSSQRQKGGCGLMDQLSSDLADLGFTESEDVDEPDSSSPVEGSEGTLCVQFSQFGSCSKGSNCTQVHGLPCATCERFCVHPYDENAAEAHRTECRCVIYLVRTRFFNQMNKTYC